MNFDKYPLIKNDVDTYLKLLFKVVESKNKKEFYNNLDGFEVFKKHTTSDIKNTFKGIGKPEIVVEFLEELCSFYTHVHKVKKDCTKWVKSQRTKYNEVPSFAIIDFLEDLGDEVHEKLSDMKDKKFNVMVKTKDNEIVNKSFEKDIEIYNKDMEICDLKKDNKNLDTEKNLVLEKLKEQTRLLDYYVKGVIEHKLKLINGVLVKLTKVKPRRTLGLENARKVRELHEKGCPIESLADTFNVEVSTVVKAIRYETYV